MTNIAETLLNHAASDHQRGCQGRCYSCECGYDAKTEQLLMQAAVETERLRTALEPFAKMADQVDEWSKGTGAFTGLFDANDLRRARELVRHEQSPQEGK